MKKLECGRGFWGIYLFLFKEPVELLDGFVKLLSWQTVVLYWIHVGIINIQGPIGSFLQNGVVVDDEGIVQIAAYYMPQSRRLIHHHSAHRIIGRIVLYAQMILHQCRNYIIMSGAMHKLLRLCARNMPNHRHANLGFREVAVPLTKVCLEQVCISIVV